MGQLMRDDVVVAQIDRRRVVEQAAVGEGRGRSVLHRAEQEVVYQYLRVFRVRVGVPELLLEEFDHPRRRGEEPPAFADAVFIDVIADRRPVVIALERLVFADDDRDQIGGRWLRLAPVIGPRAVVAVFADVDQFAVREREERRLDGGDHFGGHVLIGYAVAGGTTVRVLVVPLRTYLTGL